MTASTSKTRRLNVGRICLRAWQLAGQGTEYQELDPEQGAFVRDVLEIMIDELQNDSLMLRAVDFESLTIEAGESLYTLPDDVIGTTGTAMWVPDTEPDPEAANAELPVEPVRREEWQVISSKGAISTPSKYFTRISGDNVKVQLWPIPFEDGILRFQVHRLLGDNDDANASPDLERGAYSFLLWELAHHIAVAKTMEVSRCSYLAARAREKRASAKVASTEDTGFTVQIAHHTQWTR